MRTEDIQIGSTITDSEHAVRITGRSTGSVPGWLGVFISLASGTLTGVSVLLPECALTGYQPVPFEWQALPLAGVDHRYVWRDDWRALMHEVRRTVV